mmetsp:Transcript_24926/g.47226  ORF Transcript_24926/g.47226 Transcript_24926/m.47226 type:complete len:228 (+) Transcript_24926:289-972(+)
MLSTVVIKGCCNCTYGAYDVCPDEAAECHRQGRTPSLDAVGGRDVAVADRSDGHRAPVEASCIELHGRLCIRAPEERRLGIPQHGHPSDSILGIVQVQVVSGVKHKSPAACHDMHGQAKLREQFQKLKPSEWYVHQRLIPQGEGTEANESQKSKESQQTNSTEPWAEHWNEQLCCFFVWQHSENIYPELASAVDLHNVVGCAEPPLVHRVWSHRDEIEDDVHCIKRI